MLIVIHGNTVFPHIVSAVTILFWIKPNVLWPLVTVNTGAETIQGRKLFAEIRYLNFHHLNSLEIFEKNSGDKIWSSQEKGIKMPCPFARKG